MLKWLARSSTFCTSLSEPSRSRGVFAVVLAREYIVHNGEAQIAWGRPCSSIISGVTSRILQQIVGSILGSKSRLVHVQPCCSKAFEIDLVPQNSSSKCGIYCRRRKYWKCRMGAIYDVSGVIPLVPADAHTTACAAWWVATSKPKSNSARRTFRNQWCDLSRLPWMIVLLLWHTKPRKTLI